MYREHQNKMGTKVFNNTTKIVRDDMIATIRRGSKISIAAACFSIYAYQELKKQLESVEGFRFIFTAPTFVAEKVEKQKREFYIPRLQREIGLYGTEFEVRLRNELTQRAIAKECADWIKEKGTFKSNRTGENMSSFMTVINEQQQITYVPLTEFTTVGIGCERGNNSYNLITSIESPESMEFIQTFESLWNDKHKLQDVTKEVIENITTIYTENSPEFMYFMTLYHVFSEFLDDISEDELPNEATGFKQSKIWSMLYEFQREAVLAIINKLERYNGCILADSVGLGKTFTALAVIKYYENRNKSVLVLCPKKLVENWNTYKDNYVNNPIATDRLNYDVLFHTDLSRDHGISNGLDLDRLNWGNYDLVVIDESHNFRNGVGTQTNTKENRYVRLRNRIIKAGVKTKVLMISATPVNNHFTDLKNQLALAYEGDAKNINNKLDTKKPIDDIFKQAQKAFREWSDLDAPERTTETLLKKLDFNFFKLLDGVTIARSRKHIEKYYDTREIGEFPERKKPITLRPKLTDLNSVINYNEIYEEMSKLNLSIYTPSNYIFESHLDKYIDVMHNKGNLTQKGREAGIRRLMSINLLKRLESSVNSFLLTLQRMQTLIEATIKNIDHYETYKEVSSAAYEANTDDFDMDENDVEDFTVGKTFAIDLRDMDYKTWRSHLCNDAEILGILILMVKDITPEHDFKLQQLLSLISEKIERPFNVDNKKILIFSAFSDTAKYLYANVAPYIKKKYGLNTGIVTGTEDEKTNIVGFPATLNNVLTCFSPISKGKNLLMPTSHDEIDVLIATDCISEGQNLQDCDYVVNYDIHWNPVRIIQRFGRIDRIGSKNEYIQLVNFWPDMNLDEYINLKDRVETRMKISVMTSTGDDDLINTEEKGDLEYRKTQLKRLQEEIVDIEDMSTGVSIMDLGLNEFRLDLMEYVKAHGDMDKFPKGMHAVVKATEELPEGTIFVLKNRNNGVNIDNQNRIHPFYMVYIATTGKIICDYLNPKKLLDDIRLLCRGKKEPIKDLCAQFNAETDDGKKMDVMSGLLNEAIASIINRKEESDIDSLFSAGGTSALMAEVSGLDDFELICFLVVK